MASVQFTTCFSLMSKLRISGSVSFFILHLHEVQKDNFAYMFKLDILAETSVGQVSVSVSECNTNWKVPTGFSEKIIFQFSWKSIKTLLNTNRPKEKLKLHCCICLLRALHNTWQRNEQALRAIFRKVKMVTDLQYSKLGNNILFHLIL